MRYDIFERVNPFVLRKNTFGTYQIVAAMKAVSTVYNLAVAFLAVPSA
jgi:hypothetical protein